jgi:hypothetical protein
MKSTQHKTPPAAEAVDLVILPEIVIDCAARPPSENAKAGADGKSKKRKTRKTRKRHN